MLLSLKDEIIYGPVNSRRLGYSLGINALPAGKKACTFDCAYCQFGWTPKRPGDITAGFDWPSVDSVKEALEAALLDPDIIPRYLTFSGNGEPTIHPRFPSLVEAVIQVRDSLIPEARTAILSNSSTVNDPGIREALDRLDERILKLDCGTGEAFRSYNRPVGRTGLDSITAGLTELRDVTIQALWSSGPDGNLDDDNIEAWIERIRAIRPSHVQIYTLDRDVPSEGLEPAPKISMERAAARLKGEGIPAVVY